MPQSESRNEKLDLRLTPTAKRTLQRFGLDAKQWAKPAPRLAKLLNQPSVFERSRLK